MIAGVQAYPSQSRNRKQHLTVTQLRREHLHRQRCGGATGVVLGLRAVKLLAGRPEGLRRGGSYWNPEGEGCQASILGLSLWGGGGARE